MAPFLARYGREQGHPTLVHREDTKPPVPPLGRSRERVLAPAVAHELHRHRSSSIPAQHTRHTTSTGRSNWNPNYHIENRTNLA